MAYKVRGLYALMVVQKEAIDVRKKDLEAKEAYYKQAKALVKQGLKTKADENRFLSSLYIAKANLEDAIASFLKAKNTLELYMKTDIPDDVTLQSEFLRVDLENDFDTLEKNILSNNYQLKITQKNIEKNILLHKSSKASHYGSIDAVASYTHIDTLNSYDSKLVGVTLNIPLYSGGRVSAEEQKAKISSNIAKEQKASKELALKEEMKSLLIDIKRFEKKILASKAQLEASKETKKVLDARYAQGLATYIEVLDATTQVLSAKLSLLESYYYKSMAIYRLEYLQGIIE
jgi:outer membrane protein TolC